MSINHQISLTRIEIENGKIFTCPDDVIEICLDETTANVKSIKAKLISQNVTDPIIFDSLYREIYDGVATNLKYWNKYEKFYYTSRKDWNYAHSLKHEKKYRMSIIMIEIVEGEISIRSYIPIDLDNTTANIKYIEEQLQRDLDIDNSLVILNSNFKEILDGNSTRGEIFWNRGLKFYFTDRDEWNKFNGSQKRNDGKCKTHQIKNKKINRPFDYTYVQKPSKTFYYPVTGPRTFKKVLIFIQIKGGEIIISKNVPFDLTEPTANITTLHNIIKQNMKSIQFPVILDAKFKEVKESPKTRGEAYWNNHNKFYFIDRFEWDRYDNSLPDCEFDRIKFRNIKHKTYFDTKRDTYFKNV